MYVFDSQNTSTLITYYCCHITLYKATANASSVKLLIFSSTGSSTVVLGSIYRRGDGCTLLVLDLSMFISYRTRLLGELAMSHVHLPRLRCSRHHRCPIGRVIELRRRRRHGAVPLLRARGDAERAHAAVPSSASSPFLAPSRATQRTAAASSHPLCMSGHRRRIVFPPSPHHRFAVDLLSPYPCGCHRCIHQQGGPGLLAGRSC